MLHYVRGDGGMKVRRPIRIEGQTAYVPLPCGREVVVDVCDAPLVSGNNWRSLTRGRTTYAISNAPRCKGQGRHSIYMHRIIMCPPNGMGVDHINGNGLDNRRINLRVANTSENLRNTRRQINNMSGFKGVGYYRHGKKNWRARIKLHGKTYYLGYFMSPELAHAAYARASKELHGEFGRTE